MLCRPLFVGFQFVIYLFNVILHHKRPDSCERKKKLALIRIGMGKKGEETGCGDTVTKCHLFFLYTQHILLEYCTLAHTDTHHILSFRRIANTQNIIQSTVQSIQTRSMLYTQLIIIFNRFNWNKMIKFSCSRSYIILYIAQTITFFDHFYFYFYFNFNLINARKHNIYISNPPPYVSYAYSPDCLPLISYILTYQPYCCIIHMTFFPFFGVKYTQKNLIYILIHNMF